jgi:Kef-type K+ transport system membrane component KefB
MIEPPDHRDRTTAPASRSRHLLGYVAIVGLGLAVVVVVLPVGRSIDRAPTVPASLTVGGEATDCLGPRLVTRQSGIYLDLHVADRGRGAADPVAGDRIGRGHIDRSTGRVTVHGSCARGTALAGQGYRADLDAAALAHQTVTTEVALLGAGGAGALEAEITKATAAGGSGRAGPEGTAPLEGTELAGRAFLAAAVVILLSRGVGSLFRRVYQPRVIGEIVAGIVLGPSVVGALAPGVGDFLFPPEVLQVVGVLAQFGLIFFMFLTGLGLDLGALKGSGRIAVLVSHVSIVAPFVLGVLASLLLFPLLGDGDFAGFALFMGAAMSITAFPVLARILADTGLQRSRLGTVAITCAAIDDVTAWCVLGVVIAISKSTGEAGVARTVGLALAYAVVVLGVVRPVLRRVLLRLPGDGRLNNQTIAVLISLVLVGAWITEEIGVHAIFGAFLVGVALPRDLGVVEAVTAKLQDITELVLLPLFFVVAGLSTRVDLLDSPLLWAVTALVIALAVLGKWGGSTLAARACHLPWREAIPLGVLMNARGLTELVILTIGLDLGVISPALFTIMVVMALVTTAMTVPVLARLNVVSPAIIKNEGDGPELVILGT